MRIIKKLLSWLTFGVIGGGPIGSLPIGGVPQAAVTPAADFPFRKYYQGGDSV